MKNRKSTKIIALFVSVLMILTSFPLTSLAVLEYKETEGRYLISMSKTKIAPGITENKIVTNNETGSAQAVGYAVEVDPTNPTLAFKASYADYNGNEWKMQTVRDQAKAYSKVAGHENETIVAGFNADVYDMSNGRPSGVCVLGGKIVNKGIGRPYFGVTKEGKYVVGGRLTEDVLATLQEAISGFYMIVEDYQRVGNGNYRSTTDYVPRTAIGIKEDGTIVVLAVDGRNFPISSGLDTYELASVMLGLGCKDVINLDGGGSTTYLARYEGEQYLSLKNKPSDGQERAVSSAFFFVSTAKPTGVFDHAAISPSQELYTPFSTVQFSASGVDSSGSSAELPGDGKFVLADESFGSITEEGLFTSSGKCGTVEVNYVSDGKACGSDTIDIVNPDTIAFASDEISLGFEKESNLGLTVKYKGADINFNAADITWELSNEKLGTFSGLTFTSSDGETLTGTVTAKYSRDESINGSATLIIGKQPSVVMDFEDHDNGDGTVTAAKDYWTISPGTNDPNGFISTIQDPSAKLILSNYSRGAKNSAELVDISSGEPVRFGNYSLKINYDFSSVSGTDGATVGFTSQTDEIPGSPTGIGIWAYVPEGTSNLWFRLRLEGGAGTLVEADYTGECKVNEGIMGGLQKTGWQYFEAPLPENGGPFRLRGGEAIRLMVVPGIKMGYYRLGENGEWLDVPDAERKGCIYVDNFQFVYGTNMDDVDNPVVDSIMINNEEFKSGATINSNTISVRAKYSDVQNKYTTGVDPSTVAIYIDGKEMTHSSKCVLLEGDETIFLSNVELANGTHSVKVRIRDGFGNETIETKNFVINGENTNYTTVELAKKSESPVLGGNYELALRTNNITDVDTIVTDISIDKLFADGINVVFNSLFNGIFSYNAKTSVLHIEMSRKGDKAGNDKAGPVEELTGNELAVIKFNIPSDVPEGKLFKYSVVKGEIGYTDEESQNTLSGSFSLPEKTDAVVTDLDISVSPLIVGIPTGDVTVTKNGEKVEGAEVYANDTLIGTTGEDGVLTTDVLSNKVAKYSIYAKKDNSYSFATSIQSVQPALNENGTPEYVVINATTNPETSKNITWLSNPVATADKAIVLLAKKSDYDANGDLAFEEVNAETKFFQFLGSQSIDKNYAVRINTSDLENLEKNTEYVYKVGDGNVFSEVKTFKTYINGTDTNFFIIGDTQASDKTNINKIMENLANSGKKYSFGIQTGDSIESANIYADWIDSLNFFGRDFLTNIDIVHVLGNHEYMGDEDAEAANTIYNIPDKNVYSAQYGNVYVATMTYSQNRKEIQERLDWIIEDAKKSDAQWKILTLHQPPYYTNAQSPSTEMNELVPAAAQAAGIDFVFAGHDHSYAKTAPLYNGEVDEENGIVYFICGTTGGKSYPAANNPDFHFEQATIDFDKGLYFDISATDKEFKITVRESDGAIFDSYTKKSTEKCAEEGHKYIYDNGYLVCGECAHRTGEADYSGFATDKTTGSTMYYLGGERQKGWLSYGDDCYYFDKNGLAVTGTQIIPTTYTVNATEYTEEITYKFAADGKQIGYTFFKCKDGYTRAFRGGSFCIGWREIDGELYFFTSAEKTQGRMFTGINTINIYTGQSVTYLFGSDGHLMRGTFYDLDGGRVYYWGPTAVTGWQKIDGRTYYFDPETGYMATDTVIIDGKEQSFSMEGYYKHEGAHEWTEPAVTQEATCTKGELTTVICKKCATVKSTETKAPLGHIDEDGNGKCDVCGLKADGSEDNKVTIQGIVGKIKAFISNLVEKIKAFFKKFDFKQLF